MPNYYVNRNAQPDTGDHEVHVDGCGHGANLVNQIPLGFYTSCAPAVADARRRFPGHRIDGCYWCSNSCHRT